MITNAEITNNHSYSKIEASQVVKSQLAIARDVRDAGLIPGSGRSLGGGHSNPLQYPCLENSMDREAWWATVHRITKSQTQRKRLSMRVQRNGAP